jgi:hypothetical protein
LQQCWCRHPTRIFGYFKIDGSGIVVATHDARIKRRLSVAVVAERIGVSIPATAASNSRQQEDGPSPVGQSQPPRILCSTQEQHRKHECLLDNPSMKIAIIGHRKEPT